MIGRPLHIDFAETDIRAATDRLMQSIVVLSGQRWINEYA